MEKFTISKDYTKTIKRFNVQGRTLEFNIKPVPQGENSVDWIKNAINAIILHATQNVEPNDKVGFTFCSKDFKGGQGWKNFTNASDVTLDDVWNVISGIFQSNSVGINTNTFCLEARRRASNVGFIGLGNMGAYMATNMLSKGTKLSVYDISKSAVDPIKDKGGRVCSSPAEVAAQSDLLFTMLPNNDIVRDAYNGKDGVFSGAKKGTLFVDSSTISPDVAQSVGAAANDKGFQFIDAPVSGGVVGARDATLTFMVGGSKADVSRAEPYILQMGKRAVHCGNLGAGQVAKICNNMLLAISMIGVSESMNLGIRLGLDPKTLMDIINTSTGRCWSSEVYNPVPNLMENVPSSNNYAGGFAVKLVTKDLGLAQDVATKSHTPIPLGAMAHQVYTTLNTKGLGDKDFAVIYDFLKAK